MCDLIAFNAGLDAAKKGGNINNCYPYTKENNIRLYYKWLDGYRSFKK